MIKNQFHFQILAIKSLWVNSSMASMICCATFGVLTSRNFESLKGLKLWNVHNVNKLFIKCIFIYDDRIISCFSLFIFPTLILQMLSSKDVNFVGYTYKNFEIVNDYQVPGMGMYLSFSLSHVVSEMLLQNCLLRSWHIISLDFLWLN